MRDEYVDFFGTQRHELINEFVHHGAECLIATTRERLLRHADMFGWEVHLLRGTKPNSALVIRKGPNRPTELWVRRTYTAYRRAFQRFLSDYYGLPLQAIPCNWQVDHLLATSRFKPEHPEYFVRIVICERRINAAHGAFEKKFNRAEKAKYPCGGFHMDWITILKPLSIKLPSATQTQAAWAKWTWAISSHLAPILSEDRLATYCGISMLLNLAFTGKWEPLKLDSKDWEQAKCFPFFHVINTASIHPIE